MALKTILKKFMFKLTANEERDYGKKAAQLMSDISVMEEDFGRQKKEWSGKIESLQLQFSKYMTALRSGEIEKEVEVEVRYNNKTKCVEFIHEKKVLESRTMTEDEMQMEFGDAS